MNPIMGKLGNSVAQLLTPAGMKAGAGDATAAVANAPTAFAALLSIVATPLKAGNLVPAELKATASPNAAAPAVASDAAPNPDMLVADLPLSDSPRSVPPKFVQSDAPAVSDTATALESAPTDMNDEPGVPKPAPIITRPTSRKVAASTANATPTSPKSGNGIEPVPEKAVEWVKKEDPKSSDPIVPSPAAAEIAPAIVTPPALGEVAPALRDDSAPARRGSNLPTPVPLTDSTPVSAPMPRGDGEFAPATARDDARPAPVPTAVQSASERELSTAPAMQLMAAVQPQAEDTAVRTMPQHLPPEFATALAASRATQAKPIAESREQSTSKASVLNVDPLTVAMAVLPKDVVVPSAFKAEPLGASAPDALPEKASPAASDAPLQPPTAPVSPQSPSLPGVPVGSLAATLGQQVIDMGSGGQWIDGLAREIASLSKGEGHGSFRLSPEHLGPMRVDIRPGEQGANVTLTVETKAAESMLLQDRNILKADAQLAAVKIGDVTVERVAHVHEPSRSDSAAGQGTGQGQSQTPSQTSSQSGNGQSSSNAALAQGQGQSQNNGNHAGNRKVSPDAVVSSQAEPRDASEGLNPDATRRARYA